MITFQGETARNLIEQASHLFEQHAEELKPTPDTVLNIRFDKYLQADEEFKCLRVYSVRENGLIVGYCLFGLQEHWHYADMIKAEASALYLSPHLRGKGVGKGFLAYCDTQLKLENVQVIYHHVKATHSFAPILEKLGYGLIDYTYFKRI